MLYIILEFIENVWIQANDWWSEILNKEILWWKEHILSLSSAYPWFLSRFLWLKKRSHECKNKSFGMKNDDAFPLCSMFILFPNNCYAAIKISTQDFKQ